MEYVGWENLEGYKIEVTINLSYFLELKANSSIKQNYITKRKMGLFEILEKLKQLISA